MNKVNNPQTQISRQTIFAWINSILPDISLNTRIEELGKGVIYCRIINHYFPGVILINRIIWQPKGQYENTLNLRSMQNAMAQLKIHIPIDPIRLSKQKLHDNWTFISSLYKYLAHSHEQATQSSSMQEEKKFYGYYPSVNNPNMSNVMAPKRPLQNAYPERFFQGMMRQPFFQIDTNYQQKNIYNASKYSVGKLYKDNPANQPSTSSPNKGKWSANSHMFQNNLVPIIDRIKQILLKSSHDTQKMRQIKMLLNIPLNEEVVVKVEEDDNNQIIKIDNTTNNTIQNYTPHKTTKTNKNEAKSEQLIMTKQQIKLID